MARLPYQPLARHAGATIGQTAVTCGVQYSRDAQTELVRPLATKRLISLQGNTGTGMSTVSTRVITALAGANVT